MAEGHDGSKGGNKGGGGGNPRGDLKTRVKTARKRSLSSTLWLQRQLNDPYVAQAKRDGYRSRAAYKLLEIDERYRILKAGQRVVDLGAAPGGWSQIAARKTGADRGGEASRAAAETGGHESQRHEGQRRENQKREGRVIGIDLLAIDPIAGVEFAVMDFLDPDAPDRLKAMMGGPADVVLSDMAANTTGHKKTDHLRIVGLAELAIHFACEVLSPGGAFLSKVFQGGTEAELLRLLKSNFGAVHHVKPKASRAGSAELYVLATGFRGEQPALEQEADEPAADG